MTKSIVFYDINQINFYKYIPELLNYLRKDSSLNILLIYEEATSDQNALNFLNNFKLKKINLFNNLNELINSSTGLFVVNAQRIPDSLLVAYAKKQNVPTLMIQHGMYNGHLKRTTSLFMKKASKAIKYLLYSLKIGLILRKNPILVSLKFMQTFIGYSSYKLKLKEFKSIYADYVHVYGEYWVKYHQDFFGYNENSKFEIVGYPELRNINFSDKVEVCYIAQTLIEDGRCAFENFAPILSQLSLLSNRYKLVVKRHPRSSDDIYIKAGLEIIDELPDADIYIGHYSSLLAIPISLKKKVALIPLSGHIIPEYFLRNSFVFNSAHDIQIALKTNKNQTDLHDVFSQPISVHKQAQQIKSYLN